MVQFSSENSVSKFETIHYEINHLTERLLNSLDLVFFSPGGIFLWIVLLWTYSEATFPMFFLLSSSINRSRFIDKYSFDTYGWMSYSVVIYLSLDCYLCKWRQKAWPLPFSVRALISDLGKRTLVESAVILERLEMAHRSCLKRRRHGNRDCGGCFRSRELFLRSNRQFRFQWISERAFNIPTPFVSPAARDGLHRLYLSK